MTAYSVKTNELGICVGSVVRPSVSLYSYIPHIINVSVEINVFAVLLNLLLKKIRYYNSVQQRV